MKKFNFVYIVTNRVNGKKYVGSHCTNDLEKDKYLGSGKIIQSAVKKYGQENFEREILKECLNLEEAKELEELYINEYNTLYPNGYNLSPTGGLKIKRKNGRHGESSKEKIKKATSGKNNGMYGKNVYLIWVEKYGEEKANELSSQRSVRLRESQKGKIISEESKQKMREAKKDFKPWNVGKPAYEWTDEMRKAASKRAKEKNNYKSINELYDKWKNQKGKEYADNKLKHWKEKMSKSLKGKPHNLKIVICPHCKKEGSGPNMTRYHFNNCKNKNI